MSQHLSLTNDFLFRWLFSREETKGYLLAFINAVLKDSGFSGFSDITLMNPFNLKNEVIGKETLLDIKAVDEQGRTYDIEVQVNGSYSYRNRSLYYWSKLYADQLVEGSKYSDLKPVI